ncbi:hypothetical protein R1flu_022605 [Riccia fluitans]|uniref:Transposase n=1 Tax=Riccia fluitans TaxID=41844 RepID=A0ABD1XPN1_9MARC
MLTSMFCKTEGLRPAVKKLDRLAGHSVLTSVDGSSQNTTWERSLSARCRGWLYLASKMPIGYLCQLLSGWKARGLEDKPTWTILAGAISTVKPKSQLLSCKPSVL